MSWTQCETTGRLVKERYRTASFFKGKVVVVVVAGVVVFVVA